MGIGEILTIVFILLKVFEVITWSWWLVFLPEIIVVVLYTIFLIRSLSITPSTHRRINKVYKRFK